MTSSAGESGLIAAALPPSRTTASRIAARSTTAGTPVKSCSTTRAGLKAISSSGSAFGSHFDHARMCSAVTLAPSSPLAALLKRNDVERVNGLLGVRVNDVLVPETAARDSLEVGRFEVGLHGKNLTNTKYITAGYNFLTQNPYTGEFILSGAGNPIPAGGLGQEGVLTAYYGNPRQIFLSLGINF